MLELVLDFLAISRVIGDFRLDEILGIILISPGFTSIVGGGVDM